MCQNANRSEETFIQTEEIEDDDNEQALVVEIDDEPIDQAGLH